MIRRVLLAGLLAGCHHPLPAQSPPGVRLEPLANGRAGHRPRMPDPLQAPAQAVPVPVPANPPDPVHPYPEPDPALPPDARAT